MRYNNAKLYVCTMGIENGILANISPFSLKFGFKYQGQQLDDVYFKYENGNLMLHSKQATIPTVYAHFAKRHFEIGTNNANHFLIVPNAYVASNEKYPTISDIEDAEYSKEFSKKFRNSKIKRAFNLGIIKYLEKVLKKRRFMPL